jgi:ORF6N domain
MAKRTAEPALPRIFTVRRQKVVVDAELAELYGVPTKQLNQAVRRNAGRFPGDFCFFLTEEELANLRSQIVTSTSGAENGLRSQNVTSNDGQRGGRRTLPRVFTEHGALMAANVLRSEKAVQMSLYLIRAFIHMREQIASNLSVLRRLAEIDKQLIEHDAVLREVIERLQPLLAPPPEVEKPKMGFHQGNR